MDKSVIVYPPSIPTEDHTLPFKSRKNTAEAMVAALRPQGPRFVE